MPQEEVLLWAHGRDVGDVALDELVTLAAHLEEHHGIKEFASTGVGWCETFGIAARPTILIDKPVTLVGMGDTISSLSLAGSMVR